MPLPQLDPGPRADNPDRLDAREARLCAKLAAASMINHEEAQAILDELRADPAMLAELMALCAQPGPPPNGHMALCYYEGKKLVQDGWFGSGLVTIEAPTHHLPFPNAPSSA